ncbi:MAG: hypothetical protein QCI38_01640 [Candidatus Thermoplasmatota archaeon]|nr:hypothetical protein [Candidatus Thermoplasmatota archaeon]
MMIPMSYDQYGQQPPPQGGWEQPPPQQPPQQYPPQQPQGYQQPPPQGYEQYPPQDPYAQPPPGYGMGPPPKKSPMLMIAIIAIIAVIAIVAVYFLFIAGGGSPVGTWRDSTGTTTWTFRDDGTGTMDVGGFGNVPFTWANGKITMMGQEIGSYSVNGNTMTITVEGESFTLNKV